MCGGCSPVSADELMRRSGGKARPVDGEASGGTALFDGHLEWIRLRSGLVLHCSDCIELQDFTTESRMEPRLSFVLFMEGCNRVSYGEERLDFSAKRSRESEFQGLALSVREPVLFRRRSTRGTHVRKLSLSLEPEWFEAGGLDLHEHDRILRFSQGHLSKQHWQPSARIAATAAQLLAPPPYEPLLQRLYLESRALDIAADALACLGDTRQPEAMGLRPHEHRRLLRLLERLDSGEADDWSLEMMARDAGVNVNTLQRQFRQIKGTTLFDYQRGRRLVRAREALEREGATVGQAAWIAGYSSAANFATAFKRRFGMTPRQAIGRT
ncbi:helix-turn-helix transcriptional regulator [Pseudomonas sp. Marseille-QA0892]